MSTATATQVTFRRTKQGDWVAFGPASDVREGAEVTVTKKSGDTKRIYIERTGRSFQVDGQAMVYGYIGADRKVETTTTGRLRSSGRSTCDECGRSTSRLVNCTDSSGIGGRCCPRCASMSRYERSFC